jgi:hypothetical protein
MEISPYLLSLVGKKFSREVNCFCVSKLFFENTALKKLTADEMLDYVHVGFQQVEIPPPGSLGLVWSRTSDSIPLGKIDTNHIAKRSAGFPHGLVLEHSFVLLNEEMVFQKPDPKIVSAVEICPLKNALETYKNKPGFEITWHQKTN